MRALSIFKYCTGFLAAFILWPCLLLAGPNLITYQAKIMKPNGLPLEAISVNFKFTILNPAGSCILFSETYSAVNMSSSAGLVSFALGSGIKTFPTSGTVNFSDVFSNVTPSLDCDAGGPGNYNPSANDVRKIVMQFHDGLGWQTLPAMNINAVPYAMYASEAQKLSGLPSCNAGEALSYNGVSFSCEDISTGVTSLSNTVAASFAAITSSQWTTSGTGILFNGNVGLGGTTNPVTALDVSGGLRIGTENATCATSYAGTLRYNSGVVEYCNGTSWSAFGVAGAGINSLNGSTSGAQIFTNSLTGTAPAFVTANGIHTLNIPLASAGSVTGGLLSNADYVNFQNKITSSSASIAQALGYIPAASGSAGVGTLAISRIPAFSGDASITAASNTIILSNSGVTAGTYSKVTVDSKGRVVSSSELVLSDVTTALGYTPASASAATQWATSGSAISYMNGNVGVGVASPNTALDVVGALSLREMSAPASSPIDQGRIYFDATANKFKVSENGNAYVDLVSTADNLGNHTATTNLNLASNNITGVARVMAGDGAFNAPAITFTNSPNSGLYNSSGNLGFSAAGALGMTMSSNSLGLNGTYAPYMRLGGGVFSETTPSYAFGGALTTGIFNPSTGGLGFTVSASERMRIDSFGNVGIGTTTPSTNLHVSGTVKITGGSPSAGKVLTSDATGLASWQSVTGADNLGNHMATQNLNLGVFKLTGQGGSEGISIDSSGNIRLGSEGGHTGVTLGPGTSASGSTWGSMAAGFNSNATSISSFAFGSYATASNWYSFATGSNNTASGRASAVFGQNITAAANNSIGFGLSNSVSYTISAANTLAIMGGNVGIGTTAPNIAEKLAVNLSSNQGVRIGPTPNDGSVALFVNTATASQAGLIVRGFASQSQDVFLVQDSSGTTFMKVTSAGTVGIGTAPSLNVKLDVSGSIRPGSSGISAGGACAAEGAFAYDLTLHAPVFCNSSNVWSVMSGGVGVGQTWTNVTGSRVANDTVYTNSTGKPIQVSVTCNINGSSGSSSSFSVDGVVIETTTLQGAVNNAAAVGKIVPAGSTYSAFCQWGQGAWFELR